MKIVSGASNRAFIGLPLCRSTLLPQISLSSNTKAYLFSGRDQVLLDLLRDYAMSVFSGATVLNVLPVSLRPVVGQLVRLRTFRLAKKCLKKCLPEIERGLEDNRKKRENVKYDWEPPVWSHGICSWQQVDGVNHLTDTNRVMACNGSLTRLTRTTTPPSYLRH
jgi:hypothetical protein